MSNEKPVVRASNLSRTFVTKSGHRVEAVRGINLTVTAGRLVHVEGPSGSGKTTLLSLLGCMIRPSGGDVQIAGVALNALSADERPRFRLQHVGFVFQQFRLLGWLTAAENVMLPLQLAGRRDLRERALEMLDVVDLKDRQAFYPRELSGGEQQRVAIARALAADPPLLLADEPTGALDAEAARQVLSLLRAAAAQHGKVVIVASHAQLVHSFADDVLTLRNGEMC